eukprot:CAMPEP_0118867592 /NCGR_PEP_ID=MMETSP1163-20130328/11151_1 /TAXON_ID=124430 /ORGANISM="Phaeomonas parva, Strain CCMP2877" /LENGTH=69 /DNA_ID=CAMNT_0006802025 /DNA_START=15 /DNA_END=221 /DNA_ORIENTATION=+
MYNPFSDPLLGVLILMVFVLGDLLMWLLKKAADIKIKRFGYRGLWMTKQLEGTVDDEVAAKLAIGEGRQ